MPQILVRGLAKATVQRLKERARLGGRSLQQEVKSILEGAATMLTTREARKLSEQWHRRFPRGRFSDSAELVREERDSR
jgi:plasmid stability protein